MAEFAAYGHAIASLAIWPLIVLALAKTSSSGRSPELMCECGKPKRDYNSVLYRRERAFMNAVEISGPFIAATIAAILAGASPFFVNLFASVFIVARLAMVFVHIRTTNQPLRSACFAAGAACVIALSLMAFTSAVF
ncbi:MAPEG family protein [Paracoccus tegillarcae]|uniref:MAPEG family protein n=1 Tax=Paracoccus tegillarcae TaxID=1529068 RepID=A0A2K9EJ45_9RHOB|nr:MAPEG family protein [Paracoccus tegillarcae]AUH35028.1 MAPEG family protein [Paracoccus tegillarcae]